MRIKEGAMETSIHLLTHQSPLPTLHNTNELLNLFLGQLLIHLLTHLLINLPALLLTHPLINGDYSQVLRFLVL